MWGSDLSIALVSGDSWLGNGTFVLEAVDGVYPFDWLLIFFASGDSWDLVWVYCLVIVVYFVNFVFAVYTDCDLVGPVTS